MKKSSNLISLIVVISILIIVIISPLILAAPPYPILEFQEEATCKPDENVVEFSLINNGDASIQTDSVSIIVHLYSEERELNLPSLLGEWDKESIEPAQTAIFTSLGGQFVLRGDYVLQIEHIMLPNNLGYRVIVSSVTCEETSTIIINPSADSSESGNGGSGGGEGITGEAVAGECNEGEEKKCESIFTEPLIERTGCEPIYKCENGKWSEKCYTVKDCLTAKEDTTPVGKKSITGKAVSELGTKSSLLVLIILGIVVIIVIVVLVREFWKR